MDEILEFKNVSFSYAEETDEAPAGNEQWAIDDLSLTIKKGEFVAVLGHNGSGKSTLAKLSNAILIPDKGEVLVNGISTADEDKTMYIREHVGMVFQNPDNQIVATIVEEDVAFGPENMGLHPDKIRQRVDDALKAVDMYELKDKEPHKLSGGQKQRVAIAGIIAMQPECIVLDESTAMLDPRGRREVMDVIKKLHDELHITIVYITHYMDEAVEANRVIVMDKGKILFDAPPVDVFSHVDELKRVGLDVPEATELSVALNLDKKVLTPDECADAIVDWLKK